MSVYQTISELHQHLNSRIIGQKKLINRIFIALLADGHLLVEGAPGLAKTTAIKELALGVEGDFHRIQFTPDLLPADLTGTEIYRPQDSSFRFQQGPLFHNLLLADEINRAPAKVQSALLEAMAERQITVGKKTYSLPELFLVMATQNPIEQEGTYSLPEAQLDRFLLHVTITYPDSASEKEILEMVRGEMLNRADKVSTDVPQISQETIFTARKEILGLYLSSTLQEYLIQLIMATREPLLYGHDLHQWLRYGASPRGTIALDTCARAHAWLSRKDYVSPEDIQEVVHDVLRHRILLSFEAEAEGITPDHVINEIISRVPVP